MSAKKNGLNDPSLVTHHGGYQFKFDKYDFCVNKNEPLIVNTYMGNSKSVKKSQRRKKEHAINMMGGCCQICGYDKCINALEFHHVTNDKEFKPTYVVMRWSWHRAKKELEKCILVCANCHREIHFKELNINYENIITPFITRTCPICLKDFDTRRKDAKYCSTLCSSISDRRVERPSKNELKKLLLMGKKWTELGLMFGVTDNSVKKWAKAYNLPSTTKELKNARETFSG